MSNRYKGGVISATPPTTTGGESGVASGAWTLEQQAQLQAAGLWPLQPIPNYIEEVFSTYLYTGNGGTTTVSNSIDLAGKGGIAWIKRRNATSDHFVFGAPTYSGALKTNLTNGNSGDTAYLPLSNGFSLDNGSAGFNASGGTYASWTFRKQPKFFDVVTWTGTDNNARNISHNLGSAPGCIMVKTTSSTSNWFTYHRSLGYGPTYPNFLYLNTTGSVNSGGGGFFAGDPTSTYFPVGGDFNLTGETYVAYLFAHDAGGFGLTGTDNVISCGSFTTDSSGRNSGVTLGYEPQWMLVKPSSAIDNWQIVDNMMGMSVTDTFRLLANTTGATSQVGGPLFSPTATGFSCPIFEGLNPSTTYIYIAIRRGPMAVPTSGTSVFAPEAWTGDGTASRSFSGGFVDDAFLFRNRAVVTEDFWFDRLRGNSNFLQTANTNAENPYPFPFVLFDSQQNGVVSGTSPGFGGINTTSATSVGYHFKRAPGFFDEVCYTGTGSATTQTHNLGVAPELMIVRRRAGEDWGVYTAATGNTGILVLNGANAFVASSNYWNNTSPTSSVFTVNASAVVNASGDTYIAYLFATCAGVSKVGSYTGTATTLQIDCGFTGGARFVLIKRTDSTGDWYVWDSARGIVSGNDPYLLLNSTAAEVTNTDYVDTYSAGFEISSTAPAAINASGGTFIFLAIA